MPVSEAMKRSQKKYAERTGAKTIATRLNGEQVKLFEAYAESKGETLSMLLKLCVQKCIEQEGFAVGIDNIGEEQQQECTEE